MNKSLKLSLVDDKTKLVRNGANIGWNDILDKPYILPHPAFLPNRGRHGSNPSALQNLIMIDKMNERTHLANTN